MRSKGSNRAPAARRGAVTVYVAISLTVVIGFAALAVDLGLLYATQAELQRSADAAALAGAWDMLDESRLKNGSSEDLVFADARDAASNMAGFNPVLHDAPVVVADDDVVLGHFARQTGMFDVFAPQGQWNAASVSVRRSDDRGGSVALFFARALGHSARDMGALAIAAYDDKISGYKVTTQSGNADLLPFTLHINSWEGLLAGTTTSGDNYSYDPDTGVVSAGGDGIKELNFYPGAGSGQLPPGNFGTVDIGGSNNSTADIARQILEGVSADDLAHFGGTLEFGSDGTLTLNGDTGLSAGVKDELNDIKGQPRAIPIFSSVSGPGNNANYTIVAFAGIRIMNVKLTGPMNKKEVIIQPAYVIDRAAIVTNSPNSYYVYRPPQIVH